MSPSMISGLAALTAITGILAVSQLLSEVLLKDRSKVNDRVDTEFLKKKSEAAKKTPLFKNLGAVAAQLSDDTGKPTIRQRFEGMVEQSGMDTTPAKVLAIALAVGGGCLVASLLIRRSPILAPVAGISGFLFAICRVKKARDKRIEKLRSQLSDAFELMARVIRAGQTLGQSMLAVADEFPQPISSEFAYCYEQQNLGLAARGRLPRPDPADRRDRAEDLRPGRPGPAADRRQPGRAAHQARRSRPRALHDPGDDPDPHRRGADAGLDARRPAPLDVPDPPGDELPYAAVHFEHKEIMIATFVVEGIGVLWIRKIVNFDF